MCFNADLDPSYLQAWITFVGEFLRQESAPGSDPGFCLVVPGQLQNAETLIAFGRSAKESVLTKQDAYDLAGQLGIHLSEHGGTGQGVIGALAGTGLRLSGNDGRYRGKVRVQAVGGVLSVAAIKQQTGFELVKSLEGLMLADQEPVLVGETVKAVLLEGKATLLVVPVEEVMSGQVRWQACTKEQLKQY
jgi:hypothetical protein